MLFHVIMTNAATEVSLIALGCVELQLKMMSNSAKYPK